MSTPVASQVAPTAPPPPGITSGNGDGATITQSPSIVTATLANGDNIDYSRPTMSYEVSSPGQGYSIYGYGNGAFGVNSATGTSNVVVAISPTKDVTVQQQDGSSISLGNYQDPQTQNQLRAILPPQAVSDLSSAIATKNLSNTSIAQEFSPATISSLTTVQAQDTSQILGPAQAPPVPPPPETSQAPSVPPSPASNSLGSGPNSFSAANGNPYGVPGPNGSAAGAYGPYGISNSGQLGAGNYGIYSPGSGLYGMGGYPNFDAGAGY